MHAIATYLANFGYSIGYFSEVLMLLLLVIVLLPIYQSTHYLIFYIIFFVVNMYLNTVLKQSVKQERPSHEVKLFASEVVRKNIQVYGMPSGHSQSVFFSISYLLLVLFYSDVVERGGSWRDPNQDLLHHYPLLLGLLLFTIASLMFVQRLVYRNHTPVQLLVGAAVGSATAYAAFKAAEYSASNRSTNQIKYILSA